jgi:thiol:disulfide interchange protein DsbD
MAAALSLVAIAGGVFPAFAAASSERPRVHVELLTEVQSIRAGETFWVALRQQIAPGWHTYWMNPGDSGEPARIEWTLPAGFTAGDIVWPYPERIPVGPAMTYGYSREVVLPIPVNAPSDLVPGTLVTLHGQVSWLVCEKTCIPEESSIAVTLPVGTGSPSPDSRGAPRIAAARRAVPAPSPWGVTFVVTPETVTLTVAASGLTPERFSEVTFFPTRWGAIVDAAPQRFRVDAQGVTLELARGPLPEAVAGPIEGVMVMTERIDGGGQRRAFAVRAEPWSVATGGPGRPAMSLLAALVLAVAGGMVLNLMPCVLPILSVKALALVQHGGARRSVLRRHGLAYTAGVLLSLAVVAITLLAFRAGGEQLGWGFQLQSPVFVTLLAQVLFVVALSLSGVIVVGGRLAGVGQALAGRAGYAGSCFTGMLAVVAAAPCTAPFMATALGFAVTQPWPTALLVFQALAVGFALPYLLLTLVPAWRRFLPAPGPWMERLKQLLAFPLYASVAWLVWVVSQQTGPPGVAAALAGFVLIAFAAWLYGVSRDAGAARRRAATAVVAGLAVGAVVLAPLAGAGFGSGPGAPAPGDGREWEPFTPKRLAELRARGTPVFVNVTAAWCITCLVNERLALKAPAVRDALARKGVATLKADWTTRDPGITEMLGSFGRNGVPLYVLYPAGPAFPEGGPTVLPQILSEGVVIRALENI